MTLGFLHPEGLSTNAGKDKERLVGDEEESQNIPWVEKYRPTALDKVVHHGDIISTLRRFVCEGRLPHLLFYGPPGTGKTSAAVALAHDIFGGAAGRAGMVLELNASDERGIGVVREQIKTFAATKTLSLISTSGGPAYKLIILDECDAMTGAAQNALRRVMEKYVRNVRFILCCNYVGQIIPALQSRCTRFRFGPLPGSALKARLEDVARAESLSVTQAAQEAIIKLAGGDMRRILNVLQAASAAAETGILDGVGKTQKLTRIDEDLIYAVTAAPHPADLDHLFKTLLNQRDFSSAHAGTHPLSTPLTIISLPPLPIVLHQAQLAKGLALADILRAMFERLSEISIPNDMRIFLTKHLADIEYHLAQGATDSLQLSAMVGAFIASRSFLSVKSQ